MDASSRHLLPRSRWPSDGVPDNASRELTRNTLWMCIISMTSLTFNCPICKNQMKQIHFGKGRPNIKLEFDLGDGTLGTIDTSFMFCNVCNNLQFFVPAEKANEFSRLFKE
jgi:hypothetical protein